MTTGEFIARGFDYIRKKLGVKNTDEVMPYFVACGAPEPKRSEETTKDLSNISVLKLAEEE